MQLVRTGSITVIAALVLMWPVAGQGRNEPREKTPEVEIGKPAPDFELQDANGKTIKLADHKDKVVILEWISKDCPVSVDYNPKMKATSQKYAPRGVVWLAVDSTWWHKPSDNLEYIQQKQLPYQILMDTDGEVGRRYGAVTTPHMFIINKGTLAYKGAYDDRGSRNYVEQALDAILAGKEVSIAQTKPFGCSVKYKQK